MTENLERLIESCRPSFTRESTFLRAKTLVLSALACLGRHTVTGMLTTSARQFADWSAAYRLFAEERFDIAALFAAIREEANALVPEELPFVASLDDTLVRKRGKKVPGTSWRIDRTGPHFHPNFVWGQRFLQLTCAIPERGLVSRARAVPIETLHCPTPAKPRKYATEQELREYNRERKAARISLVAAERLSALRETLDPGRPLVVSVDGGYTNATVFRNLPERTCVVGRVRKDAKLFRPPERPAGKGRPRVYGDALPTPEQTRRDPDVPWQQVEVFAAGARREFDVKVVSPVRWRASGDRNLTLVIVRPLAYRLRRGSPLLYRDPAYLLATDENLDLTVLLQAYVWRWETEVGFRDQKTLLGLGEAQVRNPNSVSSVPAFLSAAYSLLHLAAARAGIRPDAVPPPKWRANTPPPRNSTAQLISLVRSELWGRALGVSLEDFARVTPHDTKCQKMPTTPASAVIYAHG